MGEHVGDRFQQLVQIERDLFQLELAGLDLRQVEHVVDQAQQHVGRRLGQLRVAPLLLR